MVLVHCSLEHSGSSDPHTSGSKVAGITGICHHAQLIFKICFVETRSYYFAQAHLKLLGSSDPPACLQSAEFIGTEFPLSPRLECSGTNITHYSLNPLGSSDPLILVFQVVGHTGVYHHAPCIYIYTFNFAEMGSCYVAQPGLGLLASNTSPTLVSQSTGITGMSYYARPGYLIALGPIFSLHFPCSAIPFITYLNPVLSLMYSFVDSYD
ncbi:hypothetical protein AAY473_037491, partial [Plecturocebus cupreus]